MNAICKVKVSIAIIEEKLILYTSLYIKEAHMNESKTINFHI